VFAAVRPEALDSPPDTARRAALRVVNFLTGFTPGRLFQISTNRSVGQSAASLPSSFSLLNCCALSGIAAPDSMAAMLFSLSIVKCIVVFLLSRRLPR
jgi:hypothetical protein